MLAFLWSEQELAPVEIPNPVGPGPVEIPSPVGLGPVEVPNPVGLGPVEVPNPAGPGLQVDVKARRRAIMLQNQLKAPKHIVHALRKTGVKDMSLKRLEEMTHEEQTKDPPNPPDKHRMALFTGRSWNKGK